MAEATGDKGCTLMHSYTKTSRINMINFENLNGVVVRSISMFIILKSRSR